MRSHGTGSKLRKNVTLTGAIWKRSINGTRTLGGVVWTQNPVIVPSPTCTNWENRPNISFINHRYPLLYIIIHHYISLYIIIHHCTSLYIIAHHYTSSTVIEHHPPSLTMIHRHWPWSTVIDHHSPSLTIIHSHWSSSTVIEHHPPSFTVIRDFKQTLRRRQGWLTMNNRILTHNKEHLWFYDPGEYSMPYWFNLQRSRRR